MMIQQQERQQPVATDDQLTVRLETEKYISSHHVHQEGYELGIRSASHLTQTDFCHFERVLPLTAAFDGEVLDYLWTYLDTKGCPDDVRRLSADVTQLLAVDDQSRILFCQGWIDGVLQMWNLTKEQAPVCQMVADRVSHQTEYPRPQSSPTNDGLATRLETERQILLNHIHQEGYELGLRSASHLTQHDFRHFECVYPLAANFDGAVLDYLWTYLDAKDCVDAVQTHDQAFDHLLEISDQSRILFCQGWLDGVLHVWALIKEQVEQAV